MKIQLIIMALCFTAIVSVSVNGALISEWTLNEDVGSTMIADSSGNNHSGVLTTSGVTMGGPGTGYNGIGGGAYFDGTNGYITTTNGSGEYVVDKYLKDQATISFWAKADMDAGNGIAFQGNGLRAVMTYGGSMWWETYATTLILPLTDSQYREWHFWTLVRDGSIPESTSDIYMDGQLMTHSSGGYYGGDNGSINSWGDMKLGSDGGLCYKGFIDEVRVYNSFMNGSEVQLLYNSYVPEPTSMALLGLGVLVLLKNKR